VDAPDFWDGAAETQFIGLIQISPVTIGAVQSRPSDVSAGDNPAIHIYNPEADLSQLPIEFHDFADVFSKVKASVLPPHRPYDIKIELQPGKQPPFGPMYSLSRDEQKLLREWLDDQLTKGVIRPSKSPAASPVLFAKKKDGSLRLCVDYRGLNSITIRNRGPLPRVDQLLDTVKGSTVFSKIDLRLAYNLVRVAEGDEWKTAFRTPFGLFETLVMPFGLTNAPPVFQTFIQDVLSDLWGRCVVAYLDDILVYSPSREQNVEDVRGVLERLRAHSLYARVDKSSFSILRSTI
jgi:hypothetical protein